MIYGIAAIDDKNGLANNQGIPWTLPIDKKYFKQKTMKQSILMGYKTYQALPVPLPGRKNYVATQTNIVQPGFYKVEDAVHFIKNATHDVWVIGGGDIFTKVWQYVNKLYLTRVGGNFACTVFIPDFSEEFVLRSKSPVSIENNLHYRFEVWQRKS